MNGPLPGTVFLYRGLTVTELAPEEVAEKIVELMKPHNEIPRTEKWRNSHEAKSERLSYRRQKLPFSTWKAGPNVGIAQVRDYLTLIDRDKPNPFRPALNGRARLILIVDDDQFINPKDDRGLARHRAEFPVYHYKGDKPDPIFNDAMDTVKTAAVEYFPSIKPKSKEEKREEKLKPEVRMVAIVEEENPELQQAKIQTRDLQLKRMKADEDRQLERGRKMVVPRVKFRK